MIIKLAEYKKGVIKGVIVLYLSELNKTKKPCNLFNYKALREWS